MLSSILLSCPLLFVPHGAPTLQDPPRPSDASLAPLADALGACLEARAQGRSEAESLAAVASAMAALEAPPVGVHPLRRHRELERSLGLAQARGRSRVAKGKVVQDVLLQASFPEAGLPFAYRVPKDYDAEAASYPLILAIPDFDETPAEHLRARWTAKAILDGAVLVAPAMPAERAEWDRVQVDGRPGGLCHVLSALRAALERFAIDPERVVVVGYGKGVPAAVAAGNAFPQAFAGVAGRGGDAGTIGAENFFNLPTYFAGAGANATAFAQAAGEEGHAPCTLDPAGGEDELWRWIGAHPRRATPVEVRLTVGEPFPTRAYWLRIAPTAPRAHALGAIDRATNTIRIDSRDVSHVTLYLNDALVDLGRPLRLVTNELEHELPLEPRLEVVLDLIGDGTSDAGCVYVAEVFCATQPGDPPEGTHAEPEPDPELERRLEAAGTDVDALWRLALELGAAERSAREREVLRRLVRLAPDHLEARAALGEAGAPGAWFPSSAAYERYLESQDPETARAMGRVEHKLGWIHAEERTLANKGWIKDWASGQWLSGEEQRRSKAGWTRQDLEWIAPEDAPHVDAEEWLVRGEWTDLATANRQHARLETPWRIPSREVLLVSTVDRQVALRALEAMARAVADLRKVFGIEPALPLSVALLRDEEQYDRFAFGDPDGRRPGTDSSRLHVVHSAYFADRWFPFLDGQRVFQGMGVGYWDPLIPYGERYGVHSARLALGLSYVEAIDPSPKAVRRALAKGPGDDYAATYAAEKRLPAWLRFGGAVYAERYFRDPNAASEDERWWARAWSLENLRARGGLRPLDEVFAFELDPGDREDAQKRLLEAGLLVAFVVDGGSEGVMAAHAELKRALVAGAPVAGDVEALTAALRKDEPALRAFAEAP